MLPGSFSCLWLCCTRERGLSLRVGSFAPGRVQGPLWGSHHPAAQPQGGTGQHPLSPSHPQHPCPAPAAGSDRSRVPVVSRAGSVLAELLPTARAAGFMAGSRAHVGRGPAQRCHRSGHPREGVTRDPPSCPAPQDRSLDPAPFSCPNAPKQLSGLARGVPVQLGGTRSRRAPLAPCPGPYQLSPREAQPPDPSGPASAAGPSHGTRGRDSWDSGSTRARPLGWGHCVGWGPSAGLSPPVLGSSFTPRAGHSMHRRELELGNSDGMGFKWRGCLAQRETL